MAGDPTEDIRVGIRRVSWISQAERGPWRSWGCTRGPWFKHQPPPTKTDRDSGAAESGGAQGGHGSNTNPPPTNTDRDSGVAVSRVEVTRGKRKNRSELGRKDSQEQRNMQCRLEGGKYLLVRTCNQDAHSEDLLSRAHSEALLIKRSLYIIK